MITLNSGDKYTFRNSEYYENAKFLTGYTSSGVKILIPMSKVTAIELMKNAEAVETSENTKIFFGTIAVIGLVVLKVWAKMKSEE